MIIPSAMVKAADHIKRHIMLMSPIDVSAFQYMIGYEKRYRCMIDWGAGPCYVILLEEECPRTIG
jgi:hypothetical protein